MKIIAAALAATVLAGAGPGCAAFADTAASADHAATTLDLSAAGETRIAPDEAMITLGVQTEAPSAARAMRANAEQMTRLMAALAAQGVPARAIATSNINLQAQYAYSPGVAPRLTGYTAANDVTVTVEDLPKLGATLDAVVAAGANQINGIAFGLKDPLAAENTARRAAVAALRAKAELYAAATGLHVARLVTLTEGGGSAPPQPKLMREAAMAAPQTPVSPGELTVHVEISGVYELGR